MPVWDDIFGHILAGVQEMFPQHQWQPSPTAPSYSDRTLAPVDYGRMALTGGIAAAQHTDPSSGAVSDIFQSNMPVANPTTLTIPGNPNYDPSSRLFKG